MKEKIIFFGTSEFGIPALEQLIKNNYQIDLIVTQPDKPVGRRQALMPTPIKKMAQENNLEVAQPENLKEKSFLEKLKKLNPDLIVVVAYAQKIPLEILKMPKFGCINIHPSLLPKYRGPSPIQAVILNNDKTTGITIISLTEEIDAGPIIAQEGIRVKDDETAETLHNRLSQLGAELLIKILPVYFSGKLILKSQDESQATSTKKITRQDGRINWAKNAKQIERQFRAYFPWPGIYSHWGKKRLKIADLGVLEGNFDSKLRSGEVFLGQNQQLAVKCGQGAIVLKRVQLEGKKEMSGEEFLRGYKDIVGVVFR